MSYKHRCFGKIRKIFERTGLLLTHAEITFLCQHVLGANGENFMDLFDRETAGMSKEEAAEWIKAKLKKMKYRKRGIEEMEQILAYA